MDENIFKSIINIFITNPIVKIKDGVLSFMKLFRTGFKNIISPGYLLNNDFDKNKYLSTVESIKIMLNVILFFLAVQLIFTDLNKTTLKVILFEIVLYFSYLISISIIMLLSLVWNYFGDFRIKKYNYTLHSMLNLFNSIFLLVFIFSFIFNIEQLPNKKNNQGYFEQFGDIIDNGIIGNGGEGFAILALLFIFLIPIFTSYYLFKENLRLKYSKWSLIFLLLVYIISIDILAIVNFCIIDFNLK